ncbi:MAG: hypothetical protein ACK5TH_24220 [Prosthecobacter sp.]
MKWIGLPVRWRTERRIDKAALSGNNGRHDQEQTHSAPTSRGDSPGFGEAAAALAGSGAAPGESLAQSQVRRLIEWAETRQCLIREEDFEALPLVSNETSEHEVRFRQSDRRVVKRTWNGTFGMTPVRSPDGWIPAMATPLQYLQRFAALSQLFDDDLRFEGIILSANESQLVDAVPGGCSMVISQRWLVAADPDEPTPSLEEIAEFLTDLGFEPIPDSFFGWIRGTDGLLILDAKPDNFVKTAAGILPFDLMIG